MRSRLREHRSRPGGRACKQPPCIHLRGGRTSPLDTMPPTGARRRGAALGPVTAGRDKRSLKDLNIQTPNVNKAARAQEKEAVWGSPRRLLLHINTRPHMLPPSTLTFQILFAQRGMLGEGQGQRCTFHSELTRVGTCRRRRKPVAPGNAGGPGG